MRRSAFLLSALLVAQPVTSAALAWPSPSVSQNTELTPVFKQQALVAAARWTQRIIPAFSAYGLHVIFTQTQVPQQLWDLWQHSSGAVGLAALFFPSKIFPHEFDIPWVGKGQYSRCVAPPNYHPILDVKAETQLLRERLHKPVEATLGLGELRQRFMRQQLDDPEQREKWEVAVRRISEELNRLEEQWSRDVRDLCEAMIQGFEEQFVLAGDHQVDTFARYILDLEHGLLHSLIVTHRALSIAKAAYAGRPNEEALMAHAKRILPGIGLSHDFAGLRAEPGVTWTPETDPRREHHVTAEFLIRQLFPEFYDPAGVRLFNDAEIDEIALGALRHRGQKYPRPVTELEKIFKDADEVLLVDDIERVLRQPAAAHFQYRSWDIYRRYMVQERPKSDPHKFFRHETRSADFFQFLLFTLVDRTNPANYDTPVVKAYVSGEYPRLKAFVLKTMEGLVRDEVLKRGGTKWEARKDLKRIRGIILEQEAIVRGDPQAQAELRREIGSEADLEDRLRRWIVSAAGEDLRWRKGATNRAQRVLANVAKHQKSTHFQEGLNLFDNYLEDPLLDLSSLEAGKKSQRAERYAGLAYGLNRTVRNQIQDLFRMIQENPSRVPHNLDRTVAKLLVVKFLNEVNQGKKPAKVLNEIRQILDSFRYGTQLPGTWDAPAKNAFALMKKIRKRPTAMFHGHASAMLGPEKVARYYQEDPALVDLFHLQTRLTLDPRDPAQLRELQYGPGAVKSEAEFELAFLPGKIVLGNDPTLEKTRQWYQEVMEEAIIEGHRLIGISATFDHCIDHPVHFRKSVEAAIAGMKAGEKPGRTEGVLILGMRKNYSPEKTMEIMQRWIDLRQALPAEDAWRVFGVDSVGFENDDYDPEIHLPAFALAKDAGLWTIFHVGEMWAPGQIYMALKRLEKVFESGLFLQITNPIALLIRMSHLSINFYSAQERGIVQALQTHLIEQLVKTPIYLNLSPSSHVVNSRRGRIPEDWTFVPFSEHIDKGLWVLYTPDDPGPLDTTFTEEHYMVYSGETIFGPLTYPQLDRVLKYAEQLSRDALHWIKKHPVAQMPWGIPLIAVGMISGEISVTAFSVGAIGVRLLNRPTRAALRALRTAA